MPVAPFTKAQLDTAQAIFRTEAETVLGLDKPQPAPANVDLLNALAGDEILHYRGRRFRVLPVGFLEGAKLSELEARYANQALKDKARRERRDAGEVVEVDVASIKEMLDVLEDTIALFWRLVKPISLIERLLWRWLKNPFENATEKELGVMLGFFFVCRMKSGVRFSSAGRSRGSRSRSISETSLPLS
jgi:hypothetical protein